MRKVLIILIVLLLVGTVVYYRPRLSELQTEGKRVAKTETKREERLLEDKELGYSVKIPEYLTEEKNGHLSRMFLRRVDQPGAGASNFIYISVIPKGMESTEGEIYNYNSKDFQRLKKLTVGQSTNLTDASDREIAKYYEYERLEGRMLGGYGATAYSNDSPWEFPEGVTEYRFIVPFEQATYLVGYYIGGDKNSPYYLTKDQAEAFLQTLDINPTEITLLPSPTPDKDWVKFKNDEYKLSFEYPASWEKRQGGQSFENGDLVAFQVVGQTQRPQTEMYDGLSFAVMNPIETDMEAEEWAKKRYGTSSEFDPERPPQYSAVAFGGKRYEKVVVCGLGCFTYYHIKENGKMYGFMVLAAGPNENSYMEAVSRLMSSITYD